MQKYKKIISFISAFFMLSSASGVSAAETYDVYNYDRWGDAIPSQPGYTAVKSISGKDIGVSDFSGISDIFRAEDGSFYIADSGNNRIIAVNSDFTDKKKVYENFDYNGKILTLNNPKSVFVSDDMIYIADTDNSRIIRCDSDGKADLIIEKPDSELYKAVTFLPKKVLADKTGYIYAVVDNITSGSVMFKNDGEFSGFFGANRVEQTSEVIKNYLWKLLANETMRKYMTNSVPAAITSFDTDTDGFIYTCNNSLTKDVDAVKKVNAAGYNLFADLNVDFGDRPSADYSNYPQNSFVDIDISPDGMINCLDYTNGRIFQYDEDCNLLFVFGGKGYQLGTFKQVSAIESTEANVYVADSQKNTITVFSETVFGELVHKATVLYNDGYYEEALEPWFEVLGRDGNYRRAFVGISSAYINQGRYRDAMKYAKLADSQWLYNKAFEGAREEYINKNLSFIVAVVIIIAAGAFLLRYRKKHGLHIRQTPDGIKGDDVK